MLLVGAEMAGIFLDPETVLCVGSFVATKVTTKKGVVKENLGLVVAIPSPHLKDGYQVRGVNIH